MGESMEEDFLNIIISLEDYKALRKWKRLQDYTMLTYPVEGYKVNYLIPSYLLDSFLEKGADEEVLISAKKYTIVACGEKNCSIETNDEVIKNLLRTKPWLARR